MKSDTRRQLEQQLKALRKAEANVNKEVKTLEQNLKTRNFTNGRGTFSGTLHSHFRVRMEEKWLLVNAELKHSAICRRITRIEKILAPKKKVDEVLTLDEEPTPVPNPQIFINYQEESNG